jgi:predicted NBD/HSP70 family sugar kinase
MYIVSVAMDQYITRLAITDMHQNYVGDIEVAELKLLDNPDALGELKDIIAAFIEKSGIPKEKITGIGIGMPGFVDVVKGINYSFLKATGGSIVSYLESATDLNVFIDNDSSLIALAEHRMGAARNLQNVMVVNISWGVGLGIILKGELFRGHNGFAGEFSHIPLFTNNKMCSCGKTGCLETETSLLVIAAKAIEGLKQGKSSLLKLEELSLNKIESTSKAIMNAAVRGDRFAVELFSEAGYNLGKGIAILIHLLNPELVLLSGRGAAVGNLWMPAIQQAINEHCIPRIAENTEVKISPLENNAELMGAAALVMDNYKKINNLPKLEVKMAV